MKLTITRLLFLLLFAITCANLHAQASHAPQGINYQAVARDANGQLIPNATIGVQMTIHDTAAGGAIVYRERHVVVTNAFGTFSVVVGGGGLVTGTFGNIAWDGANKYLQVETDLAGGTSYTDMGTMQLMSVPFSMYSNKSGGDISAMKFDTAGVLTMQSANGSLATSTRNTWLAGGNASLNTTNNWLGTTDNMDLIFQRGSKEALRFTTGGSILVTGDTATGITPTSGPGRRMMYIPAKGAFRVGSVSASQWDDAYIGNGSQAIGTDAMAIGVGSVAIGTNSKAIGDNSVAIGNGVIAKGNNTTVFGVNNDTTTVVGATSDILFQIGSGATATNRGNAMTVDRVGMTTVSDLTVKKGITMADTTVVANGNFNVPASYGVVYLQASSGAGGNVMTILPGARRGQTMLLYMDAPGGGGHGVRAKDNTANGMNLASQFDFADQNTLYLLWNGTVWVEVSRSVN